MSTARHRSLSGWLRAQPDQALAALLRERPDVAVPAPADTGALANRLTARASVLRALDRCDAFTLDTLDGLLLLTESGAARWSALRELTVAEVSDDVLATAVDRLRGLALAWGEDDALRPAGGVREIAGAYPMGLGRPIGTLLSGYTSAQIAPVLANLDLPAARQPEASGLITELVDDPARLSVLLARCGPDDRTVLDQLAAGPPLGALRQPAQPVPAAEANTPVRWLVAHGLLVATDRDTVELPRQVGLALRGRPLGARSWPPPPVPTRDLGVSTVDAAAAGQAATTLRLVEALLTEFAEAPPGVLRSTGLGVRDLRRAARALDAPEQTAALLAEVVCAAGLLASTTSGEPVWLPTAAFDRWLTLPPARRWAQLVTTWLGLPRLVGLVGQRDDRGRGLNVLSTDLARASAPDARARVLAALAELPAGHVAQPDDLADLLAWRAPRPAGRHPGRDPRPAGGTFGDRMVTWTLAEADTLGVTGRGALASFVRPLLPAGPSTPPGAASPPRAEPGPALDALLPAPVDHVLIQADLTVVAPGPLAPDLGRTMALVADVESSGAATVYRISAGSIRRALDTGLAAADLHELFATRSRTPVPQALRYLIDDAARRHGRLRAGSAACYLRCDDEALLTEVLTDRAVQALRLRRLAPTVAITTTALRQVLDVLRERGYSPAAESAEGALLQARPQQRRAPVGSGHAGHPTAHWPELTAEQAGQIVRAVRAGDRVPPGSRTSTADGGSTGQGASALGTLALLQRAVREERPVLLSYVNAQGAASTRVVDPDSVGGGYLRGLDRRRDEPRTFALHRITAARILDPDEDEESDRAVTG